MSATYSHNDALTLIAEMTNDLDYQEVKRVLQALHPNDNVTMRLTKHTAVYRISDIKEPS